MNTFYSLLLGCLLINSFAFGFYSDNDGVKLLNASNFNHIIMNDPAVWVVKFYVPWCSPCRSFVPEIMKLAKHSDLENLNAKVGVINAEANWIISQRYKISRTPTVLIFGEDKNKEPINYNGRRSAHAILHAIKNIPKQEYHFG